MKSSRQERKFVYLRWSLVLTLVFQNQIISEAITKPKLVYHFQHTVWVVVIVFQLSRYFKLDIKNNIIIRVVDVLKSLTKRSKTYFFCYQLKVSRVVQHFLMQDLLTWLEACRIARHGTARRWRRYWSASVIYAANAWRLRRSSIISWVNWSPGSTWLQFSI